ncbi:diacylglycerol O-acyltransferase 1 [Rhizophlyctis rosea]|nr:diacylglycerol O-acyltransferase 1 [Rhizophlyctis rosea]
MPLEFAPINVPLPRRQQTLSILLWVCLIPTCLSLFLFCLLKPPLTYLALPYLIWLFIDKAPERGGRESLWVKRWRFWDWMKEFFPVHLVKTVELDKGRNYIFGYHPHGIIALGAWINFATDATRFSEKFIGVRPHLMTLDANFRIPFQRDLLLSLGLCSVSRKSCDHILSSGPGQSCLIVVGGASEALLAHPYTANLIVKKRYGFVKLALRHGASLVPVFSFGENDIWDQVHNPPGSTLRTIQEWFQRNATFSPPLFFGRGIFTYNWGLLPYRRPIHTVDEPSRELVAEYHKKYMDALTELFDSHKEKYGPKVAGGLQFVD